ncbi:hypothetical protein BV22DRAFT_1044165 [Leucogyrophana mollusca]|uniref:Uncharacterized protein n=1 Tax=Leucogyrophana mollusca TaxID=85980 RepID=A0ACB8BSY4_9AGAM|nr:hypothetical protein BV22DRAFT_1044165 [Leucogyrophana mollusca]
MAMGHCCSGFDRGWSVLQHFPQCIVTYPSTTPIRQPKMEDALKDTIEHVLVPFIDGFNSALEKVLHFGIAIIIILEYSAVTLQQDRSIKDHIAYAAKHYLESPTVEAVKKDMEKVVEKARKGRGERNRKELEDMIIKVILENRLSATAVLFSFAKKSPAHLIHDPKSCHLTCTNLRMEEDGGEPVLQLPSAFVEECGWEGVEVGRWGCEEWVDILVESVGGPHITRQMRYTAFIYWRRQVNIKRAKQTTYAPVRDSSSTSILSGITTRRLVDFLNGWDGDGDGEGLVVGEAGADVDSILEAWCARFYPHINNNGDPFNARKRGIRERTKALEDVSHFLMAKIHGQDPARRINRRYSQPKIYQTYTCLTPSDRTMFRSALTKHLETMRHEAVRGFVAPPGTLPTCGGKTSFRAQSYAFLLAPSQTAQRTWHQAASILHREADIQPLKDHLTGDLYDGPTSTYAHLPTEKQFALSRRKLHELREGPLAGDDRRGAL